MHQLNRIFLIVCAVIFVVNGATLPVPDSNESCATDHEGKVWKVDDCKHCRCWKGKVWCDVISCTVFDNVGCSNYVKVPGTCCRYTCLDDTSDTDVDTALDTLIEQ